jgi:anti-anti-sigma factor
MLNPTVQVHHEQHALVAEFWECLRLDPAPVKEIRSKYEAHIRSKGRPMLVVDLLGVTMAGSASLGHFVMLQRMVRKSGGQIIFCNVDLSVFESFRISKLDSMFLFVPDRPAALALAASLDQGGDPGEDGKLEPTPEPPPVNGPPRNPPGDSLLRGRRRRKL